MSRSISRLLLAALFFTAPAIAEHQIPPADWTITDLGTLGGDHSSAHGINNRGQVVGLSEPADRRTTHAFLWQRGTMHDLGTFGGHDSQAMEVNERGQIVGRVALPTGHGSFVWDKGLVTFIGTPDFFLNRRFNADSINNRGAVIGHIVDADCNPICGFLFDVKSKRLRILSNQLLAEDINSKGQVVGRRFVEGSLFFSYPALWETRSGLTDLVVVGSAGSATAINNRGQIVGWTASDFHLTDRRAFLWDNGTTIELGTLSGGTGLATDINNRGQVVGLDLASERALLWEDGTVTDLGTLGGCCAGANGINDKGQITGWSVVGTGDASVVRAVIWTKSSSRHNISRTQSP